MTEVVAYDGNIDTGLKKRDRATVSKHVGGHPTKPRRWAVLRRESDVLLQQIGDAIPSQGRAWTALKNRFSTRFGVNDSAQCGSSFRPKGADPLLFPLSN